MKKLLQFITWPAVTGTLAAIVVLHWFMDGVREPLSANPTASFAEAVQRAVPSVVNIYTSKRVPTRGPGLDDPYYQRFLDRGSRRRERIQRSLGSGVIVSTEGLVLTSRHIISNADEILVLLHDGRSGLAEIIGSDQDTDLAVLRIDLDNIQAIEAGNPNKARVGDVVLAIGNPYGFGHSVSQGHHIRAGALRPQPQHLRGLHPDRCRHQPGQLRRGADRHRGPSARHQRRHLLPQRRVPPGIGLATPAPTWRWGSPRIW